MVQGWLTENNFKTEADACAQILGRMDFSNCQRFVDCNTKTNGQPDEDGTTDGDKSWSIPLTFHADTLAPSDYSWNVWADEGGVVAMIIGVNGGVNESQFESIAEEQQKYGPCSHWEGITVASSAFFNSVFTLPTRSLLGLGTLFTSPYYHEFAVRSVLPSFRAHQKLKKKLAIDYMGPSDAMSQAAKTDGGKIFGSYAYWPPNSLYDCRKRKTVNQNGCTWCGGRQHQDLEDPFDMIVPHGNMASFLMLAVMERSQFSAWLEDTKLLITDWSEIYSPGYGLEVLAPAKRTPRAGNSFNGAFHGRGVFETLSHGYTILSMYEGLATMRRRWDLIRQAGYELPRAYEPPQYKPLSDFMNGLPQVRSRINKLLELASQHKNTEQQCGPSEYGPVRESL